MTVLTRPQADASGDRLEMRVAWWLRVALDQAHEERVGFQLADAQPGAPVTRWLEEVGEPERAKLEPCRVDRQLDRRRKHRVDLSDRRLEIGRRDARRVELRSEERRVGKECRS